MFRVAINRSALLTRPFAASARALQGNGAIPRLAIQNGNAAFFSSAAAAARQEADLPSNLSFDRRSMFAPIDLSQTLVDVDEDSDDSKALDENDLDRDSSAEGEEDVDVNVDVDEILASSLSTPEFVVPLPERLKVNIHHIFDGSVSGTLHLNPSVFGVDDIRVDLIKQNVDYIRNKMRGKRKAKTKTIGEVSGSGKKVRQQKGLGKARAGHSRPAHWRGGAKAHGPKNTRDYGNVKMNKKAKRLAITSVLSQKLKEGNLIVVDHLKLPSHKTKDWAGVLDTVYGISGESASALVLDHYFEGDEAENEDGKDASYHGVPVNLWVASGNLYAIKVGNQCIANAYDILKKDKLLVTLDALAQIEQRWQH